MDRKNSDKYWNKYPRKETPKDDDKMEKKENASDKVEEKANVKPRERKNVDLLTSRTGGAYIPPAKLRLMQQNITDKSSIEYQRIAWEALKKSIHGCINKVNTSNIGVIAVELLHENIVRGRGLLCKSLIQAQAASPTFTNVYAALVAVINSKFPSIGELLLKRLVLQFKRGYKQNNKATCMSAVTFIAHLVNQRVAHEILALEILTLLVESPTDDSVEVAISFLKECGQRLTEVSSRGINAIFEMLRNILHEGQLEKRIQYMIEVVYQIRKDGFKDHAAVIQELDLVNEEDQLTHLITLDDVKQAQSEDILNVFKFDDKYEENEGKYKMLSKEILGSDESGSEESGSEEEDEDDEEEEDENKSQTIIDNTETNLTILRRTIYLTIQSSLDFEECAHKLLKMQLKPGQEVELCHMFLDCCAEQRTYEKFYGLLAERFCRISKIYVEPFQQIFKNTFLTTHRLDTNRIRNVSKFCAHLLFTDSISWEVLEVMKLNEEDSNSSNRVFIKILFQELSEYMGLAKLNERLKDPTLQPCFAGLFPKDNPKNTRFAINFFTLIGLGGLTDDLREHLKTVPKSTPAILPAESSSSDSDSSSEGSSSSSSSDSDSESSSKDSTTESRKPKNQKNKTRRNTDHQYNTNTDHKEFKKHKSDPDEKRLYHKNRKEVDGSRYGTERRKDKDEEQNQKEVDDSRYRTERRKDMDEEHNFSSSRKNYSRQDKELQRSGERQKRKHYDKDYERGKYSSETDKNYKDKYSDKDEMKRDQTFEKKHRGEDYERKESKYRDKEYVRKERKYVEKKKDYEENIKELKGKRKAYDDYPAEKDHRDYKRKYKHEKS